MKKLKLALFFMSSAFLVQAQKIESHTLDTLPVGVNMVKGSVYIEEGYKAILSTDKKIITVIPDQNAKKAGGNTPGAYPNFKCTCSDGKDCGVTMTNRKIECFASDECCRLEISKSTQILATMQNATNAPDIKWIPVTNIIPEKASANSQRIDITAKLDSLKVKNGIVLVHEEKGKYKIFASFKNNKLIEWYAIDNKGKKTVSSPVALSPTTCEDCVIMPGGVTVCKKCNVTPGVTLPAKVAN